MTVTIRPATESDSHACGNAMYVAFRTIDLANQVLGFEPVPQNLLELQYLIFNC